MHEPPRAPSRRVRAAPGLPAGAGRWVGPLAACALCLVAIAFWQWRLVAPVDVTRGVRGWNGDLYTAFLPVHSFAYRGPRLLPAWNPYQLAGMPFLAAANGVLYPPNVLARWAPVRLAIGYVSLAHVALAGVAVFACARAIACSVPAALVAGAMFMLNAYFLFTRIHPSHLAGYAWLPLVFLAGGRVLAAPGPGSALLLGVAMASLVLTGCSQMVCYGAYAMLIAGFAYLTADGHRQAACLWRLFGMLLLAGVVTASLTAVQWLPTLELLPHASRHALSLDATLRNAPLLPAARGTITGSGPAFLLALPALVLCFPRPVVVAAVCLLSFTLLVGLETPLYTKVFYHLPAVDRFRIPNRMLILSTLSLAVLAAIGLDALRSEAGRGRRAAAAAGVCAAAYAAYGRRGADVFVVAIVAAIVLLCLVGRSRAGRLLTALLVLLVLAERFVHPRSSLMMPLHNGEGFFAPTPAIEFVRREAREARIVLGHGPRLRSPLRFPWMAKVGTLFGLNVVADYEPLLPHVYHRFLEPLGRVDPRSPPFWAEKRLPLAEDAWRPLDMLAVRYAVVGADDPWPQVPLERLRLAYRDASVRIYENARALPRAYAVEEFEVVAGQDAALERVHEPGFDPRSTVLLEAPPRWPDAAAGGPARQVRFVASAADEVTLRVSVPRRALVVLSDLHWPGWRVYVDGRRRALLRANGIFRAVAVGPGAHDVRFAFEPTSVRLGATITLLTASLLVVGGGAAVVRRVRGARGGARPPGAA